MREGASPFGKSSLTVKRVDGSIAAEDPIDGGEELGSWPFGPWFREERKETPRRDGSSETETEVSVAGETASDWQEDYPVESIRLSLDIVRLATVAGVPEEEPREATRPSRDAVRRCGGLDVRLGRAGVTELTLV
jgi:hypothetical protein